MQTSNTRIHALNIWTGTQIKVRKSERDEPQAHTHTHLKKELNSVNFKEEENGQQRIYRHLVISILTAHCLRAYVYNIHNNNKQQQQQQHNFVQNSCVCSLIDLWFWHIDVTVIHSFFSNLSRFGCSHWHCRYHVHAHFLFIIKIYLTSFYEWYYYVQLINITKKNIR